MEEVLKILQAANHLQLSTKTVRKLVRQGRIPVLKFCRDIRIRKQDLDMLFETQGKNNNEPDSFVTKHVSSGKAKKREVAV